jgi:hypothetical protein
MRPEVGSSVVVRTEQRERAAESPLHQLAIGERGEEQRQVVRLVGAAVGQAVVLRHARRGHTHQLVEGEITAPVRVHRVERMQQPVAQRSRVARLSNVDLVEGGEQLR